MPDGCVAQHVARLRHVAHQMPGTPKQRNVGVWMDAVLITCLGTLFFHEERKEEKKKEKKKHMKSIPSGGTELGLGPFTNKQVLEKTQKRCKMIRQWPNIIIDVRSNGDNKQPKLQKRGKRLFSAMSAWKRCVCRV